jgi:nickel-dependent lactate racemase
MVPVPRRYDVVVTTNSGYPLDLNFYQAIKGISAAAQIVRPGGAIIAAAECWDGIPGDGRMAEVLRQTKTPEDIIAGLQDGRFTGMDQWQLLVYAPIRQRAEVYLKTSYLSVSDVRRCQAEPCDNVGETLRSLLGRFGSGSRACILPEGPQTIPYVAE